MFAKNVPENKLNDLRNDFETDYRILTGEVKDDPYVYPLDEDGNYVEGAFGRCC